MNCPERTIVSFPCSAAVTQYYAVELATAGTVSVCNAVTDKPIGWAANATTGASSTYGELVDVQIGPIVLAAAGEALNAGTDVGITTAGLLTATIASDSTAVGQVLDTASGSGSIIRLYRYQYKWKT